jgi:hypothetical protein
MRSGLQRAMAGFAVLVALGAGQPFRAQGAELTGRVMDDDTGREAALFAGEW